MNTVQGISTVFYTYFDSLVRKREITPHALAIACEISKDLFFPKITQEQLDTVTQRNNLSISTVSYISLEKKIINLRTEDSDLYTRLQWILFCRNKEVCTDEEWQEVVQIYVLLHEIIFNVVHKCTHH